MDNCGQEGTNKGGQWKWADSTPTLFVLGHSPNMGWAELASNVENSYQCNES